MVKHIIFNFTLFGLSVRIWQLIYGAQLLEYDEDIGNLLVAFMLSLISFVGLLVLWFKWRSLIKQSKLTTILFLLTSSPITISLVLLFYGSIFG